MIDVIAEAIRTGQIDPTNISFAHLRSVAGRDRGLWSELGRGRAILGSTEELDQYLYSYGPMTKSQWDHFLLNVAAPVGGICVFDYGCGQGLASVLLFDNFLRTLIVERVWKIVLIEPSSIALTRAKAVIECYSDHSEILALNKKLDELTSDDLRSPEETHRIHLFSNVLDIDDFHHYELFKKMFKSKGRHSVLAVSHNRNFEGGAARFRELEHFIGDPKHSGWVSVNASAIEEFHCSTGQPAISWQLHLEVLHGPF